MAFIEVKGLSKQDGKADIDVMVRYQLLICTPSDSSKLPPQTSRTSDIQLFG